MRIRLDGQEAGRTDWRGLALCNRSSAPAAVSASYRDWVQVGGPVDAREWDCREQGGELVLRLKPPDG